MGQNRQQKLAPTNHTPRISSGIRSLRLLNRGILNLLSSKLRLSEPRLLDIVAEALLVLAQRGKDLAVRAPDGLNLEQAVHALERNTLGLGDEEEDEEDREDHQRREEEVHAVSHGGEHLRGEARDEEVPQPVGGGGAGLGQRTHVRVEHFLFVGVSL